MLFFKTSPRQRRMDYFSDGLCNPTLQVELAKYGSGFARDNSGVSRDSVSYFCCTLTRLFQVSNAIKKSLQTKSNHTCSFSIRSARDKSTIVRGITHIQGPPAACLVPRHGGVDIVLSHIVHKVTLPWSFPPYLPRSP